MNNNEPEYGSRGHIPQQYLDTVTLDLSRGMFFLHFVFTKQKLGMFSFFISYLKSKTYLKSKLEMFQVLL